MKGRFFAKPFGSFDQDVQVTEQVVKDVAVEPGDDVILQMRARVTHVAPSSDGHHEVDLTDLRPIKVVQVIRSRRR